MLGHELLSPSSWGYVHLSKKFHRQDVTTTFCQITENLTQNQISENILRFLNIWRNLRPEGSTTHISKSRLFLIGKYRKRSNIPCIFWPSVWCMYNTKCWSVHLLLLKPFWSLEQIISLVHTARSCNEDSRMLRSTSMNSTWYEQLLHITAERIRIDRKKTLLELVGYMGVIILLFLYPFEKCWWFRKVEVMELAQAPNMLFEWIDLL